MKKIYEHILKGFSFYLPFVIVGALLLQFSELFDFSHTVNEIFSRSSYYVFELSYIALAGYIAYAISNKMAILPGFLAGIYVAKYQMGFISAILLGLIAGYIVKYLIMVIKKSPIWLRQTLTIVWIPLISVLIIFLTSEVFTLFMPQVTLFNEQYLFDLPLAVIIALSSLLAMLMAYDLGGPINKLAYMIAISTIGLGSSNVFVVSVMAGGMIPPIALGVYHYIFKNRMQLLQTKISIKSITSGIFFISEGALPYYGIYKKKASIAVMIGSLITGGLMAYEGISSNVIHGGLLMFWTTSKPMMYLLVIVIGILISNILLLFLINDKKTMKK